MVDKNGQPFNFELPKRDRAANQKRYEQIGEVSILPFFAGILTGKATAVFLVMQLLHLHSAVYTQLY